MVLKKIKNQKSCDETFNKKSTSFESVEVFFALLGMVRAEFHAGISDGQISGYGTSICFVNFLKNIDDTWEKPRQKQMKM